MDVLSDVLSAVHLRGALYFDLYGHAPWVVETPPAEQIRSSVMPDFERIILFHLIVDGATCWAGSGAGADQDIQLQAGDLIICTNGVAHYMGSDRAIRAQPDLSMYYTPRDASLPFVYRELGGKGRSTHIACGYFGCDARPFNPIVDALPGMFSVRCTGPEGELIQQLFRGALAETKAPRAGSETILSRLSELMFLHAVRQHIDRLPEGSTGWLAGLRDPQVHAALRLMHGFPARPWSLEALAGEVGMSRSSFAAHFTRLMGMAVMQYLANWRLQLASSLLERPGISIDRVAEQVGYESSASFNRAFKRNMGVPPGTWRRQRQVRAMSAPG
jgi:AraC-like DNA-binding protein